MSQVNPENFPKEDIKLKSKIGRIVAIGVLAGVIIANGQKNAGETDNELDSMISDNTLEVSIDDINDNLSLIINDNDCGNAFFEDFCQSLEEQGIEFRTSRSNDNLDYENSTVITLDQQMVAGEGIALVGPQKDGTANHSEALLMSMLVTLHNDGWEANAIAGIPQYQSLDNGDVIYTTVPSPTEQAATKSDAQITLAIGTMPADATIDKLVKDVTVALGRYSNYLINDEKHVEIVSEPNSAHAEYDNSYYFDKQILAAGSFSYSKHVEIADSKSQHHAK